MDLTFHWTINTPSGQVVYEKTYTSPGLIQVDESIPVIADHQIIVAIDVSQVKSFQIAANGDVTVKTNSSSSPNNTLNLRANVPYQWNEDSYNPFKLTVDVTKLYVTNANADPVTLSLRAGYDPSP